MKKRVPSSSVLPRADLTRFEYTGTARDDDHGGATKTFRAEGTVAPESGQQIGRYEVIGKLGAGGMGQVYRAIDPELQRQVAIKVHSLHPGSGGSMQELRTRLLREGRALACISDPNVVAVYDVGLFRGQVFVAMELVAGSDLWHWIRAEKRSVREIVTTYLGAASGLAAAHRVGVIHRDVKPANIVIGDDNRVRVLDFGIACAHSSQQPGHKPATVLGRISDNQVTHAGRVMGTPAYIAPEQLAGLQVDNRSDQFSFCVALWEALSGALPFAAATLQERANAIERGVVQGKQGIPRPLRDVLLRGLHVDPRRRHSSMEALSADLRGALARPRRLALIAVTTLTFLTAAAIAIAGMRQSAPTLDSADALLAMEASHARFDNQFEDAIDQYSDGRFNESLAVLEQMMKDPELAKQGSLATDVRSLAAEMYAYKGNEGRADELIDLVMESAKREGDQPMLLNAWILKMPLRATQRDAAALEKMKAEARALAIDVPIPSMQVELERAILLAEMRRGDLLAADSTARTLTHFNPEASHEERAMVAESRSRLALLREDYERAHSIATLGLAALARDDQAPPTIEVALMLTRATALYQLGQKAEANEIFAKVFGRLAREANHITDSVVIEFVRARLSQGQGHLARLALAELEHSPRVEPTVLLELRARSKEMAD